MADFTSVEYSPEGNHLANGTNEGTVEITDIKTQHTVNFQSPHLDRVGVIQWFNNNVFVTGSKDFRVLIHDLRQQNPAMTFA